MRIVTLLFTSPKTATIYLRPNILQKELPTQYSANVGRVRVSADAYLMVIER